jgi:DNA-binding NarL/FixJ family response regulator
LKLVNVLLADDHALVRAGIRALAEKIEGVAIVAEASRGQEALSLIRENRPDLVLLDITMPEMNGFEVLDNLKKEFPGVRVVVLTVHDSEEYAVHAIRAGAHGFLPKSAAGSELELAIKAVMRGEFYLSPEFSKKAFLEHVSDAAQGRSPLAELTPRQREVLRMIAERHSTKDIARNLNISAKTVESHRAQLMERLNIHDVAGLVHYAIKTGLVRIDE